MALQRVQGAWDPFSRHQTTVKSPKKSYPQFWFFSFLLQFGGAVRLDGVLTFDSHSLPFHHLPSELLWHAFHFGYNKKQFLVVSDTSFKSQLNLCFNLLDNTPEVRGYAYLLLSVICPSFHLIHKKLFFCFLFFFHKVFCAAALVFFNASQFSFSWELQNKLCRFWKKCNESLNDEALVSIVPKDDLWWKGKFWSFSRIHVCREHKIRPEITSIFCWQNMRSESGQEPSSLGSYLKLS